MNAFQLLADPDQETAEPYPGSAPAATLEVVVELSRQMSIAPSNGVRTFKALSAA